MSDTHLTNEKGEETPFIKISTQEMIIQFITQFKNE